MNIWKTAVPRMVFIVLISTLKGRVDADVVHSQAKWIKVK